MTLPNKLPQNHDVPAADAAEREARRHQRRSMQLDCEVLLSNGTERRGITVDVSPGSAFIQTQALAKIDDVITVRIDRLGHFEAVVARIAATGLAVRFIQKREKVGQLADRLTALINGDGAGSCRRDGERIAAGGRAWLALEDGRKTQVDLVNVSPKGAALATSGRIAIGTKVLLDGRPATVVRHHQSGIAVAFDITEDPLAEG